jgi:hypothetical protein
MKIKDRADPKLRNIKILKKPAVKKKMFILFFSFLICIKNKLVYYILRERNA